MKHIVYLSYDGLSDTLGQSQILPYIYGLNKNRSFQFTVISFEKRKTYQKLIGLEEELSKRNINWLPLKYTKTPPILSTIWDIFKLKIVLFKIRKNYTIDLIHCRSYITSLVGLSLNKSYNIPFIFDMRGFFADERIDGKIWNKENFLFNKVYKFLKKKEIEFLQKSKHTISLTVAGKKEIHSWGLPDLSPITIIPCCTDKKLFNRANIKDLRKELMISENDFIISYVGSTGTWYMLDEMLEFFKVLLLKKRNAKFLFITKDNSEKIYHKCSQKNISKSAIIIKESSREMMPSYIGISNFSIFFILPFYSKKASSPTKMGEIMNLGIPIICNSGVGDVDEVMEKSMPELIVKKFTKTEYERIIDLILNDFKIDKKIIIKTSQNYYSLNDGVNKYLDIYKQILN